MNLQQCKHIQLSYEREEAEKIKFNDDKNVQFKKKMVNVGNVQMKGMNNNVGSVEAVINLYYFVDFVLYHELVWKYEIMEIVDDRDDR